ncbi:MAG: biotin--[acetyl-CoA-carboxylase] ligase [Zetaproteobacteria bacterium]|nr:MAG: biotin--[acetyl-CoA-carboxylase] ligase [Zetaproteobacteria bacterium]
MNTRQLIIDTLCQEGMISGDRLAQKLGLSRSAIWKHMQRLRENGVCIEAVPGRGYRLCEDLLNAGAIQHRLPDSTRIGRTIEVVAEVRSTNSLLLERAETLEDGFVLLADKQTQGRGRLGRQWHSEPGQSLTFSVLLKPDCRPEQAVSLPLVVACSLHRSLAALIPAVRLKWPNDLLVRGAKLAGILMEMRAEPGRIQAIVVGIGMNIRQPKQGWPPDLRQPAVDIESAAGCAVSRNMLAASCLQALDEDYTAWLTQGFAPFRDYWWRFHLGSDRKVRVHDGHGYIEGIARSIDEQGGLVLHTETGIRRILAGDLELLP